jgi:bisphosphoglycerate-independent phosphoglycerate mutase (AlkP superfamily)
MNRYKLLVLSIPDGSGCLLKQEINTHKSADAAIELFDAKFTAQGLGRIVSIVDSIYAMDRDNCWDRVKSAYSLIAKDFAGFYAGIAIPASLASDVLLYDLPPAMQAISGVVKPAEMTGGSLIVAA